MNMRRNHQKPTDSRPDALRSSAPALLAAVSLLSASLGVSGTAAAEGSEPITGVNETNSTNIKLAQYSKTQLEYGNQSKQQLQSNQLKMQGLQSNQLKTQGLQSNQLKTQGLQSNQNKLERKAGKGQQEFLQSNQLKTQGLQSNQNKVERKALVKGQHIPEVGLTTRKKKSKASFSDMPVVKQQDKASPKM